MNDSDGMEISLDGVLMAHLKAGRFTRAQAMSRGPLDDKAIRDHMKAAQRLADIRAIVEAGVAGKLEQWKYYNPVDEYEPADMDQIAMIEAMCKRNGVDFPGDYAYDVKLTRASERRRLIKAIQQYTTPYASHAEHIFIGTLIPSM